MCKVETMHTIEGSDCSPFTGDEKEQRVIGAWVRHCEASDVMTFSERKDRDLSFAHYAAQEGRWWAGRLVGESFFRFEDCHYRIVIRPRFGEAFVFQLIESIFNLRLPHSAMQLSPQSEQAPLLKRIVAYLWLHQLAQANQHFASPSGTAFTSRLRNKRPFTGSPECAPATNLWAGGQ